MSVIGFDLETHLITDQCKAPKIIVGAVNVPSEVAEACGLGSSWGEHIRDTVYFFQPSEIQHFLAMVEGCDLPVVAHNAAFDWGCIAAHTPSAISRIFKLFRNRRLDCTYIRTMILHNSRGRLKENRGSKIQLEHDSVRAFSLAGSLATFAEIDISEFKDKEIQTSYRRVEGIPYSEWPSAYREYLVGDVRHLPTLYAAQDLSSSVLVPRPTGHLTVNALGPSKRRSCFHFCLHLASLWGVRVDLPEVARLRRVLEEELTEAADALVDAGFAERLTGRALERAVGDGKLPIKTTKKLIQEEVERSLDLIPDLYTDKGNLKTSRDVLVRCQNDAVVAWAKAGAQRTLLSTFIPALESSRISENHPFGIIHTNFFPYSDTGRVSAGKPNLLNVARDGGIRECLVAREGCCFVDIDYEGNEMRVLAQVLLDMLGSSRLASFYQEDSTFDPHSYMASRKLGIDYTEGLKRKKSKDAEFKKTRQIMKCVNFGFPGGMSAKTFVEFCKGYKVSVTVQEAEALKTFFFQQFPEIKTYLYHIGRMCDLTPEGGVGYLKRTGMVSGGRMYCQLANFHFQSLAAEGALMAFAVASERAYTDRESALWGTRPVLFVHDEILLETPLVRAHNAAIELKSIMEECMRLFTPDIPAVAEVACSLRWTKEAFDHYDSDGMLIPSDAN